MSLSTHQIRFLRGLSHELHALVTVADKGLTPNVIAELEAALNTHELIKVKLRANREKRKDWIDEIARLCHAQRVHVIGQVACFYRRNAKKPVIAFPGEA